MATRTGQAPATTGVHHFSPTVSDVEASAEWYSRVFGLERVPVTFPHHGDETGGFAVLLADPRTGLLIGLHHHESRTGDAFDERRTGLDHLAWGVAERADLDTWAAWLDEIGVAHSGVIDATQPVPYSVVVFRDPDNIQLELIHSPT
jgi:catechol 2,3-dioxygenase-like lactoylglutathione lyase family enzyme